MLGHTVEGFEKGEKGTRVLLKDEQPLEADMVILAIGVAPDSHLAKEAGLELGIKGSIVVTIVWKPQRRIFLQQAMLWK